MANTAAVPRLNQPVLRHGACALRLPKLPVIQHPMAKMGDKSLLKVNGGSTSLDLRRSKTFAGYPSMSVATCVSWSEEPVNNSILKRKRRYRKRAMATRSRSDEEILEVVTERLVDGFEGLRQLFRSYEPKGEDYLTKEALLKVLYKTVGNLSTDHYYRMLKNLGLDQKETISFDLFVSRFKEFGDIQRQWTPPLKREAEAVRLKMAHPEEDLRNCQVHEWGELKVAPEATCQLKKALRERTIDFRSILPDECFVPDGVVTKLQLRVALQEIGVSLTDGEYRKFWEHYDKKLVGFIPLERMYSLMELDPDGNPTSQPPQVRTPVAIKPIKGVPPRNPAKAAREFAQGRHKVRGDPWHLEDGIRGEGIQSPASSIHEDSRPDLLEEDKPESPTVEAAARSKIRSVMTPASKPTNQFECIIDSLHHKFEERYNSMVMAFRLFDLHNDGSVMRIDFRRVLREYGFSVTALLLGPLISRMGLSIKHGLISYQQVLSKLMNRTDPFTSTILDDYITCVKEGRSAESGTTGAEASIENILCRVVQTLHQDYVKMSAELLRKDRVDQGLLPPADVRGAIDKCLGQPMSEVQWEKLQAKLPYDADGNVRYADFMVAFNTGEPGDWNLLKHGIVTVPRNKVVNTPTEEVKQLQRSKTDMYPQPVVTRENRPVEQLRQELKQFFSENLHAVDHRFKELDRKASKRFSKWQFGAILRLCGFMMTEKELNDVWMSLKLSDDNMSTFNGVVMEFAPNFTPFHGNVKDTEGAEEEKKGEETEVQKEGGGETKAGGPEPLLEAECAEPPRFNPQHYFIHIVLKAKPTIRKNWEQLRQSFRNQDPHGFGTVSFQTLQRILDNLNCGLTKDERDQLCSQFDFKRIGRCNYLAFMKMFSEPPPAEPRLVYAPHRHKMNKQPQDAPKPITISEALHRVRHKLIKHWKNLRRAFQKHDKTRTGLLTVADFKRVLAECSIPLTEEDLYHILSEFDSNMDGRISYPEFLDALLRMDALTLQG
ncbi:hypothetical protein ACOMHN_020750 [Nucella lapillus]